MTSTKLDISPQLCLVAIMYRRRWNTSLHAISTICALLEGVERLVVRQCFIHIAIFCPRTTSDIRIRDMISTQGQVSSTARILQHSLGDDAEAMWLWFQLFCCDVARHLSEISGAKSCWQIEAFLCGHMGLNGLERRATLGPAQAYRRFTKVAWTMTSRERGSTC